MTSKPEKRISSNRNHTPTADRGLLLHYYYNEAVSIPLDGILFGIFLKTAGGSEAMISPPMKKCYAANINPQSNLTVI